jgi:hypothetical protein
MTSKVQGEGDYEAARKYNQDTREFVKDQQDKGKEMKGSAADAQEGLTPAEKEALARAKGREQDKRDAEVLRNLETKR